jgi:hypothetical protein
MAAIMLEFLVTFGSFGLLFHIQASFWESLFHEYVLDLTPARRIQRFRTRAIWTGLWRAHVDHAVLHHHMTFRHSYIEMFRHPEEEVRLRGILERQYPLKDARTFTRSQYGASFTWKGLLLFGAPLGLNFLWLFVLPTPTAVAGCVAANLLFSTPYLIFSKWVHPYMHMRFDLAMHAAPPLLRLILGSTYGVAIRVSHYVHHQDPRTNYNLQYLADLVRGRWRRPRATEWDQMIALGLIEPRHRQRLEGRSFLFHSF